MQAHISDFTANNAHNSLGNHNTKKKKKKKIPSILLEGLFTHLAASLDLFTAYLMDFIFRLCEDVRSKTQ